MIREQNSSTQRQVDQQAEQNNTLQQQVDQQAADNLIVRRAQLLATIYEEECPDSPRESRGLAESEELSERGCVPVRVAEIRVDEVGVDEVGVPELRVAEIRPFTTEVREEEVGVPEIRALEVGAREGSVLATGTTNPSPSNPGGCRAATAYGYTFLLRMVQAVWPGV